MAAAAGESAFNSTTGILYSYDAQAGSYTAELVHKDVRGLKDRMGRLIAAVLNDMAPQFLEGSATHFGGAKLSRAQD